MARLFITLSIILLCGYATSWSAPSEDVYPGEIYSEEIGLKEPADYSFPRYRQKAMGTDALPPEPTAPVAAVPVSDGFPAVLIVAAILIAFDFCRERKWFAHKPKKR